MGQYNDSILEKIQQNNDRGLTHSISSSSNLEERDAKGNTCLLLALKEKKNEIAKALIEAGADVNAKNFQTENALRIAVSQNNIEMVYCLLNAGAVDNLDSHAFALIDACNFGYINVVKALIEFGFDLNIKDMVKETPLTTAAALDKYKIVKLLIENGADINITDDKGRTPLMLAISHNCHNIVDYLLSKNADISIKDYNGNTAFLYASSLSPSIEMTKKMLDAGANVNDVDCDGKNALSKIIYKFSSSYDDIINLLIDSGIDVSAEDKYNKTAIHYCYIRDCYDLAKTLLVSANLKQKIINILRNTYHDKKNIEGVVCEKRIHSYYYDLYVNDTNVGYYDISKDSIVLNDKQDILTENMLLSKTSFK